jgi:hypothetical protein
MTFSRLPYNFEEALAEVKSWRASHVSKREWVGLTEGERIDIIDEEITTQDITHYALAQAIEAELRSKNT